MTEYDEFLEWAKVGYDKGWISDVFCNTHDGDPYMSEEEEQEWEQGGDPCMSVFKVLI